MTTGIRTRRRGTWLSKSVTRRSATTGPTGRPRRRVGTATYWIVDVGRLSEVRSEPTALGYGTSTEHRGDTLVAGITVDDVLPASVEMLSVTMAA